MSTRKVTRKSGFKPKPNAFAKRMKYLETYEAEKKARETLESASLTLQEESAALPSTATAAPDSDSKTEVEKSPETEVVKPAIPAKKQRPASKLGTMTLDQLADSPLLAQSYLLPHLVPENKTSVFIAQRDLKFSVLMLLLAYCVAGGKRLDPFGTVAGVPTLLCMASGPTQDMSMLGMISERDPHPTSIARAKANLSVFHRGFSQHERVNIDSTEGQRTIVDLLPTDCKLVVFDNLSEWITGGKLDESIKENVVGFLTQLHDRGISVVFFDQSTGKGDNASALLPRTSHPIRLTVDPAAPYELGGGFNILRTKVDFDDTVPSTVQLAYKVIDGKFDFGWTSRDPKDQQTAKQVEIIQRQLQVDNLLLLDMTQKEIAALLEVDAATISRDAAHLKQTRAQAESVALASPASSGGANA